jgi:four helix bundle protein
MERDLENRTKAFSVRLIQHLSSIRRSLANDVISRQLIRSGTSIGANYREANRAVSRADFANKIGIIQKEASETQYWLELLQESGADTSECIADLHREATELLAIFTAIGRKLNE